MLQVRYSAKEDAFGPGEKVLTLQTSTGDSEEVIVHEGLITNGSLRVAGVERRDGEILIELPVESVSGNWRIWVSDANIKE